MGGALALPLLAALAAAAPVEVELGVRAEGRGSAVATAGPSTVERRAALSAVPRAAASLEAASLRLRLAYAPRIWASDLEADPSPLVSHAVEARLDSRPGERWHAETTAAAVRGRTDPLEDAAQAIAAGAAQLATTRPLPYESLRTGARAERAVGPRTTAGAGAAWTASRGVGAEALLLLPYQRELAADATLVRLASERDTLRLSAGASRTFTGAGPARATSDGSQASLAWRRRLGPVTDGWLSGGAALTREETARAPEVLRVHAVAELGLAQGGEGRRLALEASAGLASSVDRFSGEVVRVAQASCAVRWRARERLTLAARAAGGARTDGEAAFAGADLRATWPLGPRLSIEAALVGRWQRDTRPEVPSFGEGGLVAGVAWESGPRSLL